MAANVFGLPITDEFLKGLPDYIHKDEITATDRATVALQMKTSENKAVNARTFVDNLKKAYGNGVSTKCLLYNATGGPLEFVLAHDYEGHIGPSPYPLEIANGQWGAFLHVKQVVVAKGSKSCVVYRGKNENGAECDWLLGWFIPWKVSGGNNHAYTQIRGARHYQNNNHWSNILRQMQGSGHHRTDTWNGCVSTVIIGSGTTAVFEANMTLEGAARFATFTFMDELDEDELDEAVAHEHDEAVTHEHDEAVTHPPII